MTRILTLCACALILATAFPASAGDLDLDQPGDAVRAMRKIQCNLEDGEPAVYWWTGRVYSRVPGEKDRMLFTYHGMNVRACKTIEDPERGYGYRMVSREVLIYQDPRTGEFVDRWTNPWTGEELEVFHIANDPVNSRAPTFAHGPRGDFRLPATFKEGRGWMSFEVPLFYTNPMGGEYQEYIGGTYQAIEMFNFFFDEARLIDGDVKRLDDTHVAWSRVSKWLPWMRMGDRAGQMMYNGAGKRVASFDALPEPFKSEIKKRFPKYDHPPPLDDTRPNETSWTYMKKQIDAAREAEAESGQ